MLTRFTDFDRTFTTMDELRRRMDRVWDEFHGADPTFEAGPRVHLFDTGADLVLKADLPGVAEKAVKLSIHQDVLTLEVERKAEVPEGFTPNRRERAPFRFSRAFALPVKIDAERAQASLKEGVLTVTVPKLAEAKPRQIAVRAS